jgi:GAF domain-containing protein
LPVKGRSGEVFAVLDVDSDRLDDFSRDDADGLGAIVRILEETL